MTSIINAYYALSPASPATKVTGQGVPLTDPLRRQHIIFILPPAQAVGRPTSSSRDFSRRASVL